MDKIRQKSINIFTLIVLIFSMFSTPITVLGESTTQQTSNLNLYQTTEEVIVENTIAIEPNTYLYGSEKQEQPGKVFIQFGKSELTLNKEKLNNVEITEESPIFKEYKNNNALDKIVDANQKLYPNNSNSETQVTFLQETTYPVVQNEQKDEILYIGNVEFYLTKEEEVVAETDQQQEQQITTEEEKQSNTSKESTTTEEDTTLEKDSSKEESNLQSETENVDREEDTTQEEQTKKQEESSVSEPEDGSPKEEKVVQASSVSNPWETSTSQYFKVNEEKLPVYDNRSGKNIEVGYLTKGQVYPRISSYGPNWHKIQYGDIYGYVYAPGTTPVDGSQLANENSSYENQNRTFATLQDATVYDNTSGELVPFGEIKKGKSYPVVSDYGNWWRVLLSDRVGYVNKDAVKLNFTSGDEYFRVLTDNLPIYDNRSGDLVKVGELTKGQIYPRISDYGPKWHKIQFGNITGYVYADDTESIKGASIKNKNKSFTNQKRTITPFEEVTVYDNSSGKLVEFGKLVKGKSYPIASDYGNWWRVILSDRIGYVNKDAVRASILSNDNYFRVITDSTPIYDNRTGKLVEVGELTKGQVYPRISDYGPNWHKIQYGNINGFVYTKDTEGAIGNTVKNEMSNFDTMARSITPLQDTPVYDNSSGKLVEFATLREGKTYPKVSNYGNWWRVVVAGREGFVHKDAVKHNFLPGDKYFKVILEDLPVYDNRGSGLKKVGELRKGQTYPIVSNYGNWWRIQFGDIYGYVHKSGTEYGMKSSIKNLNKSYSNSKDTKIIASNEVKIYDNSSGKLVPFGNLDKGTIYPVATHYGDRWWRIIYSDRIGYIRKSEVNIYGLKETKYDYSFADIVDTQMDGTPKRDGAGKIPATRGEVEFYANPLNFPKGTKEYYQFLVLSKPLGLNAKQVNERILYNKGNLKGQAQAFIDAGKEYNINEAYLIAHALHETGNGDSTLATGIPVDKEGKVTRDSDGNIVHNSKTYKTVYNMYGYGAYDSCPIECGAKYAFDQGWFTQSASIIGGAKSIYNYINRGQDTLYKMRWNPISPGYPQYATHVAWATLQTGRIAEVYSLLDDYTLYIDIPVFNSQPVFGNDVFGMTNSSGSNLNFRSGPSTNYDEIGSIPDGSKIEVIGSNPNGWYKVKYSGKTGWVSATYVNLIY
ncbi:SH3 domain-containing protein [Salinibacillus xinjiangensis]|uniref:SH3 domain-containing protein n=1 Tax=Salinibacillus xinjiangensis TaxID=1229268 RepID=A0A6G1X2M4_9BACI|nr:SH3 domain-containing protein [Salinibacillus xinjiangensis]MRG85078.1 SH3 domain-containing protein [Salinibacillus xinjiangensis]